MDSLIALQIIVKIEQQLGIVIEDDDLALELLNDTGKLTAYIEGQSERVSS
ncbi:acyl carrier protein [compost metagenome]